MTIRRASILALLAVVSSIAFAQTKQPLNPITVDCNSGQSLNSTLAKLNKQGPNTVSVSGTCSEYVQVIGFENLTLKGLPGATLTQPTTGPGNLANGVLYIQSSRSVTVDGFSVQASLVNQVTGAILIGHGSSDIRLRNSIVQGGTYGIFVFEHSQVSIAYVTSQDPAYGSLGVYDFSDVHVERSELKNSSGALWHVGMDIGASSVSVYDTRISNMQQGITAHAGSSVAIAPFDAYYPSGGSTDVTIENSAGTSYNGVAIDGGGALNIQTAKLVINKPGQSWGGTTGGILLSDGANLISYAPNNLVITGSYGQGIVAVNNSHATLAGATVTNSLHGGLVVANLSTIDVEGSTNGTLVSGNSVDLFCDSASWVTGTANISGSPTAQCANLLATETVTLP
jgi:hypothetical protein